MMKDNVFQDDCFELYHVALPINIFIFPMVLTQGVRLVLGMRIG